MSNISRRQFLKSAGVASLADAVISSGKYELWNAKGTVFEKIAYNYLFNLENENSNPMGFKRNQNKEYILQVAYDHDNNKIGKNVTKVFGGDGNAASAVTIQTGIFSISWGQPITSV